MPIWPPTAGASIGDLAAARGETARYRQLVVDLENNAPPPFFGTGAPDDLKLIVGVGPVLERMLQQLGITTYRQIARWSERDIDEFDAKLPEFPGRIRRDGWVTQARELHQSKYGAPPSPTGAGVDARRSGRPRRTSPPRRCFRSPCSRSSGAATGRC